MADRIEDRNLLPRYGSAELNLGPDVRERAVDVERPRRVRKRGEPRRACSERGCERRTTYGKPYCEEHVLGMPYAAWVAATEANALAARAAREALTDALGVA